MDEVRKREGGRKRRTLEKSHRAVEAFGAQLVVAKRPEQLAHEDVDLLGDLESPHVPVQQFDLGVSPFRSVTFLEPV